MKQSIRLFSLLAISANLLDSVRNSSTLLNPQTNTESEDLQTQTPKTKSEHYDPRLAEIDFFLEEQNTKSRKLSSSDFDHQKKIVDHFGISGSASEIQDQPKSLNQKRILSTINKTWGTASDWPSNKIPDGNEEEVIIEQSWNMTLDISTAIIKHLKIYGTLRFDSNVDDLTLNAKIIEIMQGGRLLIGDLGVKYSRKAKIILHGVKTDKKISIGPELKSVNKAIINSGLFVINSSYLPSNFLLEESARVSSTTLKINNTTGLRVGSRIVLPSSSTKAEEYEEVTIDAINENTISIDRKLSFYHHRNQIKETKYGKVSMHGMIMNLTRNVVIEGSKEAVQDNEESWGCVIINIGFGNQMENMDWKQRNINFNGVEISNCGQHSENLAAMNILNNKKYNDNLNIIKNCSIHNSYSHAIDIIRANSFKLEMNNLFMSKKKAIHVEDSKEIELKGNYIINVKPTKKK